MSKIKEEKTPMFYIQQDGKSKEYLFDTGSFTNALPINICIQIEKNIISKNSQRQKMKIRQELVKKSVVYSA